MDSGIRFILKMTRKNILTHAGSVSHEEVLRKAHAEYDKYMQTHLTRAERDYLEIMNIEIKEIEKNKLIILTRYLTDLVRYANPEEPRIPIHT